MKISRKADKCCAVPGCDHSVYTPKKKWGQQQKVCRKHYYAKLSGRAGPQWKRDIHNFHRKGHCEACGVTAHHLGSVIAAGRGVTMRVRELIKEGMKVLQGDHIDGRHDSQSHFAHNIRTLCPTCHVLKSRIHNDHKPVKYR